MPLELTVVKATPGLRDYRKRLSHRTQTDPFKPHFTAPDLAGTKLGSKGNNGFESNEVTSSTTTTSSNGTSTVTKETTKTPHSESTTTTTETETETDSGGERERRRPGRRTDLPLQLRDRRQDHPHRPPSPTAARKTGEPEMRHEVLPPAALPSEKAQAVTYMGISPKTHNPLLLISDAVDLGLRRSQVRLRRIEAASCSKSKRASR